MNLMKRGKKAQGLSVTTLILIVLGVLVLVMLISGFLLGWNKILPFINPPNNVQSIASACLTQCSLNAKFDYCTQTREINFEDDSIGDIVSGESYSCYELAKEDSLGIDKCEGLCPELESADQKCIVKTRSAACSVKDIEKECSLDPNKACEVVEEKCIIKESYCEGLEESKCIDGLHKAYCDFK